VLSLWTTLVLGIAVLLAGVVLLIAYTPNIGPPKIHRDD
jgi:hypothetical protein